MEENKKGCVYFFKHIGLNPVKIGYSTNETPLARYNQFKTYAPYGAQLLGFIKSKNPCELESVLHSQLIISRLEGEWFNITEEEVKYLIKYYSNVEDVKEKNDFELNYCKFLNDKDFKKQNKEKPKTKKELFILKYKENPNLNKTIEARKTGVSRTTIYKWTKKAKL